MNQTMVEKLVSTHVAKMVRANDMVLADVDLVFTHDANRPHPIDVMAEMGGTKVFDPRKVVMLLDHYMSPVETVANLQQRIRTFAHEQGTLCFESGQGISHQLLPEQGLVSPGMLIIGADSHTCTYGALNALGFGVGSSDVAAAIISGKVWLRVPESYKVIVEGVLSPGVFSKDLILHIIHHFGASGVTYKSVEFHGSTIATLSMDARMTIANMVIEMGAKAGIMPADEKTLSYARTHGAPTPHPVEPDPDAHYAEVIHFDGSKLEPQVALPHQVDNVSPIHAVMGQPIQQAVIGTCTNSRIEDLRIAAHVLKGRTVDSGVRLFVVPSSRQILRQAMEEGIMAVLHDAGAIIGVPGCNACVGGTHFAVPADDVHMVTTANRNFRGRTGNPKAFIYLASPATVAASAVAGKLEDPRPFFRDWSQNGGE